jgi:hypothetical protein
MANIHHSPVVGISAKFHGAKVCFISVSQRILVSLTVALHGRQELVQRNSAVAVGVAVGMEHGEVLWGQYEAGLA